MTIKKYINELKRRNVFKASIAYLVVAWIIAEVASIVLPAFDAPPYLLKTLLFILGIGFFILIIFSWTYDLTEDGLKKTKSIKSENPINKQTSNRLSKVIIIGLSLVIVLLLINQFITKKDNDLPKKDHLVETVVSAKKIAVLPFLNTKSDESTDYLGFALADQIIGGLVYVNAINIRPSSYIRKYEKTTINPVIIGKELDVEYLLLGNYLMEGDVIRLNIELVNTGTISIVFRESLQLSFQSAFELQDIVSKKIIDKLKLHFAPKEQNRIQRNIPSNTLAYEYYLRSLSFHATTEGSNLAIEMLKKSIELDSTFAPSFSELGLRTHYLANFGLKGAEEQKKAESYYLKALSLNDELLSAYYGLSTIYTETGRTIKSVETIKKILDINPNDSKAHKFLGYIYRYAGLIEESIEEMKNAEYLDNTITTTIGIAYIATGEYEEAFKSFEKSTKKDQSTLEISFQGTIKYRQRKMDEAMALFNKVHQMDPGSLNDLWVTGFVALIEGDKEKGLLAAHKFEEYNISDSEAWFFIGTNYALLGDKKSAIRCLTRSVDGGYFNYTFFQNEPFLDSLRDDKEFKELLLTVKKKHLDFKKKLSSI